MKKILMFITLSVVLPTTVLCLAQEPIIESIIPDWGWNTEETEITIGGINFNNVAKVGLFGGGPRKIGSLYSLLAIDIHVAGQYAYVANQTVGLKIIDITDPANLVIIAVCDTPGAALGVYVSNGYAYLADGESGLQVITVSDPASPGIVGSLDTPGSANEIFVAGNYAYVADGDAGLQIINVSDPANPVTAGSCETPGTAYGIYVNDGYAYVADGASGLQVIDVSNPGAPLIVETVAPAVARDVFVSGNYAYVANGDEGLLVIDISTPDNPAIIGKCPLPGTSLGIYVAWPRAYVAVGQYGGLLVVDIKDPANPVRVGSCDTSWVAQKVHVVDNLAYVVDWWGLQAIDISAPDSPVIPTGYGMDVFVSGDYAFVLNFYESHGLKVIDISDPANPAVVGSCDSAGNAIWISGNYAYVAAGPQGLQIVNVSDPANPQIVTTFATPGAAEDVFVTGDHAFIAGSDHGLQIVDISDPSNPALHTSFDTGGTASGIYVSNGYAFVADGSTGLQVINISDTGSPSLAGSFDTPGNALDVFVASNRAYIADGGSGLQIVDITDPDNPAFLGSCQITGGAGNVQVSGDYAFVSAGNASLEIVDISESPFNPQVVDRCRVYSNPNGAYVSESHVYVSFDGGAKIIKTFESCDFLELSPEEISAVVPPNLPEGSYNLLVNVKNEASQYNDWGVLENGFEVLGYKQECGNGILDPGEECDDGNNIDGDGCTYDCLLEFLSANGQRADVNNFLVYIRPTSIITTLPAGTPAYVIEIKYGDSTIPGSFKAELNEEDITALFTPSPNTIESVSIPLEEEKNTLVLAIDGIGTDGKLKTDKDRLRFNFEPIQRANL